jgi:hypothetical protein
MEFGQSRFLVSSPAGHASWPLASLVSAWLLGLAVATGFLVARSASSPTAAAKRTQCMSVYPCPMYSTSTVRGCPHATASISAPPRSGDAEGGLTESERGLWVSMSGLSAPTSFCHTPVRLAAGSLTAGHSRRARTRARARAREIVNERVHMHPSPLITADEGRPTPASSHALVHFVAAAVCDGMSESRSRIHGRGHVACNEHGAVHGRRENGARASVCVGFAECRALQYGMSHF